MKKYFLLFSSLIMLKSASGQTLKPHLWEHRVVLLFASSLQQAALQHQSDILTKEKEEVTDRDIKIYVILPEGGEQPDGRPLSAAQAKSLYSTYEVPPGTGFTFMLIGKDGTEKMRKKRPVAAGELFSLIDSMPMRKAEMRRNSGDEDKKN
ncbi:MAG: DUF4174 domain-containing protein [Lewinellaceae bacterium]|nr:DUF4174 domain-containing protein [Lewinellaceae bacterium]